MPTYPIGWTPSPYPTETTHFNYTFYRFADEDECQDDLLNDCADTAWCINEIGTGFHCECPPGTIGDPLSLCEGNGK